MRIARIMEIISQIQILTTVVGRLCVRTVPVTLPTTGQKDKIIESSSTLAGTDTYGS